MKHTSKQTSLVRSLALALGLLAAPLTVTAGAVAHAQHAARIHAHHRVSMAEARRTALARVPGKVRDQELEHERGRWIYSFEIHVYGDAPRLIHEVNVDADSGRIVDVHTERG